MQLFNRLADSVAAWKEARFLKKHHCRTRKEYEKVYDTKMNPRGRTIDEIYFGYAEWVPIDNPRHVIYTDWGPGISLGLEHVATWCANNCRGTWRCDWHQVDIDSFGIYHQSCMGFDFVFFAFTDPRDAMMFRLRW